MAKKIFSDKPFVFSYKNPDMTNVISPRFCGKQILVVFMVTRVVEYMLKQVGYHCLCFAVRSDWGHSCGLSPNVSVSASFLAVHFSIHTSRFIRLFTQ